MKKSIFHKRILSLTAASAAALMLAASLGGCGGAASGGNSALNASQKYAESVLSRFVSSKNAASFAFTDEACAKATLASMLYKKDIDAEGMQQIARNLFVDTITITDEKGVVAASYPEGNEGKKITELGDQAIFNKIVKGMSEKLTSDPKYNEDSEDYTVYAGVKGAEGGAVVVGYNTKDYADVAGDNLAKYCGVNTIALEDDSVISTTLNGADRGENLDSLGIKDEDLKKESFSFTVDGTNYTGAASVKDKLIIISAVPA